jgi:hypothetical protein
MKSWASNEQTAFHRTAPVPGAATTQMPGALIYPSITSRIPGPRVVSTRSARPRLCSGVSVSAAGLVFGLWRTLHKTPMNSQKLTCRGDSSRRLVASKSDEDGSETNGGSAATGTISNQIKPYVAAAPELWPLTSGPTPPTKSDQIRVNPTKFQSPRLFCTESNCTKSICWLHGCRLSCVRLSIAVLKYDFSNQTVACPVP